MSRYSDDDKRRDALRALAALKRIEKIGAEHSDVVVVRAITIRDICSMALDTTKGPQMIGDVCSRDEIVHILRAFADSPCGDPALIAQYALDDYRQTHKANKE